MGADCAAAVVGCAGLDVTHDERRLYQAKKPWGFILFSRNVATKAQLRRLCHELRDAVGREDVPIFVDQEGGRVARLRGGDWYEAPAAAEFGALYERNPDAAEEACRLNARIIADDLRSAALTGVCAPVLDVPTASAHDIIGDRALSTNPRIVARLGAAACAGFREGGVIAVLKHIPGHGRALSDSHVELPVVSATRAVLRDTDFVPFRSLKDEPAAMTAHVLYSAYDASAPATLSRSVISKVIRDEIGFEGLLMSDDLSMSALSGSLSHRAGSAIAAGCDVVLHCNGDLKETAEVIESVPILHGRPGARCAAALKIGARAEPLDRDWAIARVAGLLKETGASGTHAL